ncbi:tyrosine-type recombinase/integrase [Bdellovibrionota bacterium FG-2]
MKLGSLLLKRIRRKPRRKSELPRPRSLSPQNALVAQSPQPQAAHPALLSSQSLTLAQFVRPNEALRDKIEAFLLDQRSEHTRRAYGKDLKRFVKFLLLREFKKGPDVFARTLDRATIIAYKDALLSEGLQHTSVDRHLATLRSFFGWLVEDGVIEKSPVASVRFLNPKRISKTSGFSDEEVLRVLGQPDLHSSAGVQHFAILMLLFYCGLRRSELCSLRTSNLSLERHQRVLKLVGKGNAERLIPLVPAVWAALERYFKMSRKDASIDGFLFGPTRNNRTKEYEKPLDPSAIFYLVRRYSKLAGIQRRVSPHSCRATAISNARDHNVPDRAIQEFAGWATPDMITRYDKRKNAVEKSAAHWIKYSNPSS